MPVYRTRDGRIVEERTTVTPPGARPGQDADGTAAGGDDPRIGVGRNGLGRNRDNRIALPFGDTRISRRTHLWVNYDPLPRAFSVAPGNSTNLAYLNDGPIEERMPLADGATIAIGRTKPRFAAFCGDRFAWPDAE